MLAALANACATERYDATTSKIRTISHEGEPLSTAPVLALLLICGVARICHSKTCQLVVRALRIVKAMSKTEPDRSAHTHDTRGRLSEL